ncbi:MAG: sulfur carrier protein ThiS [Pseudomonadota bacterium]
MRITVNGEDLSVDSEVLAEILQECGYEQQKIATAVNGEFVCRSSRDTTKIKTGDRIEIVAPISGG